jgi:carbon monoxide dehydrogenase subunit G
VIGYESTTTIARPAAEVFAVIVDPDRMEAVKPGWRAGGVSG